ncbi:catechol-2,3-dioxygenase [Silvimonas terrae]|uniref:Catechol-2,3-dioxygenase n=1 Tax=Silvimonas terrae TaxID=300266 RepID=A0A840RCW0_9NEIS|nr:VOC family protein [Silvimonas terrae]MBB5190414.1 catechol-2,3-dioxygenase [Silvimonas terrae]
MHISPPSLDGQLRLSNLALAVADLPNMVNWYQSVLGFKVDTEGEFPIVGARYAVLEGAGLRIELITRTGANFRPVDRSPPPFHLSQLGWKALVLHSEDLKTTTAVLRAHDVEICWAEEKTTEHLKSTLIRDPEGNFINIFGPLQDN